VGSIDLVSGTALW